MLFHIVNNQIIRVKEIKEEGIYLRTSYQRLYSKNKEGGLEVYKKMSELSLMQLLSNKLPREKGDHPIGSVMMTTIFNNETKAETTKVGRSFLHPKDHWNTKTALYIAAARSIPEQVPFFNDFLDKTTLVNSIVDAYLR